MSISLKFTKKDRAEEKKQYECCGPTNDEEYPYNTQMRFDKRIVDQSDVLKNANHGDKIMVTIEASVREVRVVKRDGKKKDDHSVELQFEDVEFSKGSKTSKGSNSELGTILGEDKEA